MDVLAAQEVHYRVAQQLDIPAADRIKNVLFPGDPHTYAQNILYPSTRNMVAVLNDTVIGYASALTDEKDPHGRAMWQRIRPYIGFIGVHPNHKGKGIGTQLLKETCVYIFQSTEFNDIYLECSAELVPFYARSGFVELPPYEIEEQFGKNPSNSSVCRLSRNIAIS